MAPAEPPAPLHALPFRLPAWCPPCPKELGEACRAGGRQLQPLEGSMNPEASKALFLLTHKPPQFLGLGPLPHLLFICSTNNNS